MRVVYSPRYRIDIGTHVFPTQKYQLVYAALLDHGVIGPDQVVEPEPASWQVLELVHTREYLEKLRWGRLTPEDLGQLELPWSEQLVEGFRTMVGGTVEAARLACGVARSRSDPLVVHLGGGLHHAFPDHGEGFCPLNDVAVAVRVLQSHGLERIAIVDLDVHHGNGTAFIFASDPDVFTLSIHQQHNYPMWKPRGSLDIGLPDGTGDAVYLAELDRALGRVIKTAPQCVFYLAGADPYEGDQLGGLRLTRDGLRRRDRKVIDAAVSAGAPLVITLAGGYAHRVDDTVAIHAATVEELRNAAQAAHSPGGKT
jgi:acetoin utilization deacetylase AcuC-like enzyme